MHGTPLGHACTIPAGTTRCGQWAGATHPTGMHSCLKNFCRWSMWTLNWILYEPIWKLIRQGWLNSVLFQLLQQTETRRLVIRQRNENNHNCPLWNMKENRAFLLLVVNKINVILGILMTECGSGPKTLLLPCLHFNVWFPLEFFLNGTVNSVNSGTLINHLGSIYRSCVSHVSCWVASWSLTKEVAG